MEILYLLGAPTKLIKNMDLQLFEEIDLLQVNARSLHLVFITLMQSMK